MRRKSRNNKIILKIERRSMKTVSEEKLIFVERWKKAIEKREYALKSNAWLANKIGIDDQTLRRYTDSLVDNKPTLDALKKISEFLNVSADYLLGITDVMDSDLNLREFCDKTGLSEEAVNKLSDMKNKQKQSSDIISKLIEGDKFCPAVVEVAEEVIKEQTSQMRNELNGSTDNIVCYYLNRFNKKTPIIDYERQYKISKNTIYAFERVVMDKVCENVK